LNFTKALFSASQEDKEEEEVCRKTLLLPIANVRSFICSFVSGHSRLIALFVQLACLHVTLDLFFTQTLARTF
jgi:hypothetical protein